MMQARKEYKNFLAGKTVCLAGPAPSIRDVVPKQGSSIDDYDVVVRINKSLPVPENLTEFVGSKTNVLYNCLNQSPEAGGYVNIPYLESEIDWLVCPYPDKPPFSIDIKNFNNRNCDRIKFTIFDLEEYNLLESDMKTRPNSGVLAILDLLSCDIKELYITGITFFKGGYIKEYRNYTEKEILKVMAAHGNHDPKPQLEYMKEVLKKDNRVKMDKFLEEIVYKE